MAVLVTGANGFIGRALILRLAGKPVVAAVRRLASATPGKQVFEVGDISGNTDWSGALTGVNVVVHAAGRTHILMESSADPAAAFRRVNVDGTLALARQSAAAGVRRFVFISSVGVNGNQSSRPFVEADVPCPVEPYAVSKLQAENALRQLATTTAMDVVIIRPPLVYGPAAPGNFGRLLRLVQRGVPLPLGAIRNRRSFVALGNLIDFIELCIVHPAAANETFLVCDGEDLSTPALLRRMGQAIGRPARLVPVPQSLLIVAASLVGRRPLLSKLVGTLQVDMAKARNLLGWSPPFTVDASLQALVDGVQTGGT